MTTTTTTTSDTAAATPPVSAQRLSPARLVRLAVHPTVVLNVAAPLGAYQLLHARGASELVALSVAAVFPLAAIVISAVRSRRLEPIGALSLAAIIIGVAAGLVFHDPHVLLVKDSVTTAAMGLTFLATLVGPRPMIYLLGRQLAARSEPDAGAAFTARWATSPAFRRRCQVMTTEWGLALTAEATLRIALAFLISPATLMSISPLLTAAVLGPLAAWTWHRRAVRLRQDAAATTSSTSPSTAAQTA